MRPAEPDDINARFGALIAQFDEDEIRRMTAAAETAPMPGGRRGRAPLVVLVLTALFVVFGLIANLRPDVFARFGAHGPDAGGPAPQPYNDHAVLRPAPATGVASVMPPADPFAGSRAAGFADGEKGIVPPKARALGGLSRAQVTAALRRVRRLVAAARLDPAAVKGKRPEAFIALLHPEQRRFFLKHLDKGGQKSDTRGWLFTLWPGSADLTTENVKTDGEMTLAARHDKDGRRGVTITVDYLFVHAVNRPGNRSAVERLVEHYQGRFSAFQEDGELVVWMDDSTAATAGASCDFDDWFIHPYFDGDPQKIVPTGVPRDPYDRKSDAEQDGCTAQTGT